MNLIIALQHENWEDDGGDHTPTAVCLDDSAFQRLVDLTKLPSGTTQLNAPNSYDFSIEVDELDDIVEILSNGTTITFPATIDYVINIWHKF